MEREEGREEGEERRARDTQDSKQKTQLFRNRYKVCGGFVQEDLDFRDSKESAMHRSINQL